MESLSWGNSLVFQGLVINRYTVRRAKCIFLRYRQPHLSRHKPSSNPILNSQPNRMSSGKPSFLTSGKTATGVGANTAGNRNTVRAAIL